MITTGRFGRLLRAAEPTRSRTSAAFHSRQSTGPRRQTIPNGAALSSSAISLRYESLRIGTYSCAGNRLAANSDGVAGHRVQRRQYRGSTLCAHPLAVCPAPRYVPRACAPARAQGGKKRPSPRSALRSKRFGAGVRRQVPRRPFKSARHSSVICAT